MAHKKFAKLYSKHIGINVSETMIDAMLQIGYHDVIDHDARFRGRRETILALQKRGLIIFQNDEYYGAVFMINFDVHELRTMKEAFDAQQHEMIMSWIAEDDAKRAAEKEAATSAPEETPVADTETAPTDDDDDYEPMFSYMRGELNDMEAQTDAPTPADDDNDDYDYSDENHGNLAIELPQEYAVFNLHGGYEELANTMHNRLDMRFNLTTDLFGDNDEPVTIADIDDILDDNAYDGWRVFVDGWWDNELRLYAQRDGADSEDATPSRYSDWRMIDADHGYLTIGTPV